MHRIAVIDNLVHLVLENLADIEAAFQHLLVHIVQLYFHSLGSGSALLGFILVEADFGVFVKQRNLLVSVHVINVEVERCRRGGRRVAPIGLGNNEVSLELFDFIRICVHSCLNTFNFIRTASCGVLDGVAAVGFLHHIGCLDDNLIARRHIADLNFAGLFVVGIAFAGQNLELARVCGVDHIGHFDICKVARAGVLDRDGVGQRIAVLHIVLLVNFLFDLQLRKGLVVNLQDVFIRVCLERARKDVLLVIRIELIAFIMLCVVPLQILDSYRIANISLQSNTGICRGSYIRGLRIIAVGILPVILN